MRTDQDPASPVSRDYNPELRHPTYDPSLSSSEAARVLGVKAQTLRKWRLLGHGPRFVRLGASLKSRAVYRPADIDTWLAARTFNSTTEETVLQANREDR
jgi:transposase-like protein